MKRLQIAIFLIITIVLLLLNNLILRPNQADIANVEDMVNHQQVSPQNLVNDTFDIIQDNYYDSSLNKQDWNRWKSHYKNQIFTPQDAQVAIDTMLASLNDPYSRFMDKAAFTDQNDSIKSEITGIGVNITSEAGKIKVVNVVDDTPAKYANILPNDVILSINGKNINGLSLSEVVDLVRGPKNTFVKLVILRNNDKLTKNIMRKEIKIKTVKSSMEKNLGYIQINSFIGSTTPN